jgi:antitoxin component YwqK of YwqJK toxin-antitoxin module
LHSCGSKGVGEVPEFPVFDSESFRLIKIVTDTIKGDDYFYVANDNPDISFVLRIWPNKKRMTEMFFYKTKKHGKYKLYDTLGNVIETRTYYLDSLIVK